MQSITDKFKEHPASVGENYFEHLRTASGFSARMAWGAAACFLHGVFPFLCEKTGSRQITELHDRMVSHRCKMPIEAEADTEATRTTVHQSA